MPLSLSVLDPVPPTPPEEHHVPSTLAAGLAQDRLLHRAVRLDRVIAALHARARAYEPGAIPPPLSLSLVEFEAERRAIQARLAALEPNLDGRTPRRGADTARRHDRTLHRAP